MTNHADFAARWADGVATEIRAEMARQRKTQADLAEALGISPSTARNRLEGKPAFTIKDLGRIAVWLGVDPMALTPRSAA
jgi:transcriptional regulator with XRE-family HTH domain